ncbi:hypothetical protein HNQ91_002256 [Filimonas zeae]|nr:hypothetical protein [Filimonas zeae]MDR6339205.1 hypothetical protein [Filimonas zeae]
MKVRKMKAKVLIVGIITVTIVAIACKKDQFTTRPQLKFKSVNSELVMSNQSLVFYLQVTDKEGDLRGESRVYSEKVSRHCADAQVIDSLRIPDNITSRKDLDVEVEYAFQSPPKCVANSGPDDTCYFKFWIKDEAKNVSDTIISPTIIIR